SDGRRPCERAASSCDARRGLTAGDETTAGTDSAVLFVAAESGSAMSTAGASESAATVATGWAAFVTTTCGCRTRATTAVMPVTTTIAIRPAATKRTSTDRARAASIMIADLVGCATGGV